MQAGAPADGTLGAARGVMNSLFGGLQWSLDRLPSVAYAVVDDFIFERFAPYQRLREEVWTLVEASAPAGVDRRDVRVLDIACGPGNFTCRLAEAGFTVTGLDTYGALVEVAKEKRRGEDPANVALRPPRRAPGDTRMGGAPPPGAEIHFLSRC